MNITLSSDIESKLVYLAQCQHRDLNLPPTFSTEDVIKIIVEEAIQHQIASLWKHGPHFVAYDGFVCVLTENGTPRLHDTEHRAHHPNNARRKAQKLNEHYNNAQYEAFLNECRTVS